MEDTSHWWHNRTLSLPPQNTLWCYLELSRESGQFWGHQLDHFATWLNHMHSPWCQQTMCLWWAGAWRPVHASWFPVTMGLLANRGHCHLYWHVWMTGSHTTGKQRPHRKCNKTLLITLGATASLSPKENEGPPGITPLKLTEKGGIMLWENRNNQ